LDKSTQDAILVVYGLGVPLSALFWLVALLALRQFDEYDDDWKVLRVVASAGFMPAGRLARFLFGACGLMAVNMFPVLFLTTSASRPTWPWMLAFLFGQGVCLALFVSHALWLRLHDREG
jgi:hypothetical protein